MADLEAGVASSPPRTPRSSGSAGAHTSTPAEPPRVGFVEPPPGDGDGDGEGGGDKPAAEDKSGSFWATSARSFLSSASGVFNMFGHQGGSAGDMHVKGKATMHAEVKERRLSKRGKGRRFLLSVEFQVFMVLVILVDVGAFVVEEAMAHQGKERPVWPLYVNITTLTLYSLEILAKMLCFGLHSFFRDAWNVFDLIVVVVSAVFFDGPGGAVVAAKLTKTAFRFFKGIVKVVRVGLRLKPMSQAAKSKVSKNKFRLVDMENNFDLDLTYIDTDLVAMGVPTVGFFNTFVRNSLYEVARFFKINHHGHFRVYNACPEMPYPEKPFNKVGGSMTCFQIQDHSPPRMEQFLEFLADARDFKGECSDNVLAVHCKAGKGRTGSLCCAWLLYARRRKSVEKALEMFAERRTDTRIGNKLRGVETPSQITYVKQLFHHLKRTDSWLHSPKPPPAIPAPTATLHRLTIDSNFFAHPDKIKGVRVLIQCFEGTSNLAEPVLETEAFAPSEEGIALNDVVVRGDVRVALFADKGKDFSAREAMLAAPTNFNKSKGLLAYFCFHTGFMYSEEEAPSSLDDSCGKELEVDVSEMDKANKRIKTDKRDGRFSKGAQAVLHFSGGYVPPHRRSSSTLEEEEEVLERGCDDSPQDAALPRVQESAWKSRSDSARSTPSPTDRSRFSMSYAPASTSAGAFSRVLKDGASARTSSDSLGEDPTGRSDAEKPAAAARPAGRPATWCPGREQGGQRRGGSQASDPAALAVSAAADEAADEAFVPATAGAGGLPSPKSAGGGTLSPTSIAL